ncbi:MAG TPA: TRAP transporter large permease subunit, partial [Zeimonas sp.]|nr:TRAP transporter large permease subunit [Zeimonas sp.]
FTLMGMGVMFAFFAYMSRTGSTEQAIQQTLDLMVQRAYAVMANDVLIAVPLFVFMGYLVERANLIEKLFKSLHLALVRLPGSLAVATIFTCAVFATATGIVGAVVTLMGLLALPAMLKAGYDTRISAGSITAGGCLGILIPPSVLLIVYGATAGVSVVQLYAGAFFPGLMLAGLYVLYVIVLAKLRPKLMPPLPESERRVPLAAAAERVRDRFGDRALPALLRAIKGRSNADVAMSDLLRQLFVTLLPALAIAVVIGLAWRTATAPTVAVDTGGLEQLGGSFDSAPSGDAGGLAEPEAADGEMSEPPGEDGELAEPEAAGDEAGSDANGEAAAADAKPEGAPQGAAPPGTAEAPTAGTAATAEAGAADAAQAGTPVPTWFWVHAGIGAAFLLAYYALLSFARLEIFRMLLSSFFPLAVLILAVLGAIVFGLATPSEAAAVGSFGGFLLAIAYRQLNRDMMKESVFLTAKTTAMVCWLFVGSSIFSAAFALLGGQEIIEQWVLSLGLTKVQFLLLSQVIIFLLGWPLEWTEIIVIFMPIFIPLLAHFDVDPLFFGLLVALNLQTAFLSPPVAMAAFYLKGVAPPHVTLGQIFMGMMPFMAIQVFAIFVLYVFPGIGLWLPEVLYR